MPETAGRLQLEAAGTFDPGRRLGLVRWSAVIPPDGQIREALAGNLRRCTGYQKIIDAVHLAAGRVNAHHGF